MLGSPGRYKVCMQVSVYFLHVNDEWMESEILNSSDIYIFKKVGQDSSCHSQ